ncbi:MULTISPECIES: hypothetical protein [unclassified Streptomyces]|uniref:hypothetical protein n=1 Tax=unclassified Streptomyces TaxID=2593676 RepID=UPI0024435FC7|nr:hypothetical protein [Streptomyces sp. DH41]MDG9728737.1 hypothetical protein [Streptomyces sp. DH41]
MARARTVRRAAALGLGVLWWWAVLRLALAPGAGVLEGAVAVGGWGLSVLPVHCVPRRRAAGAVSAGRWRRALSTAGDPGAAAASRRPRPAADPDSSGSGSSGSGSSGSGSFDSGRSGPAGS